MTLDILYCIGMELRNVMLDIIYIICVPTPNRNNILCKMKMADFERRQLQIGLEFGI